MIDFLSKSGISKHTIMKLYDVYEDSILFNLSCNDEECLKIIDVMKHIQIDINVIENLLINRIDLFLMPSTKFVNKVEKVGVSKFVQMLSQDLSNIDILYED